MEHAQQCGVSERHACQLVHQPRGTQRYQPTQRNDEDALTRAIIALANQYGRYGCPSHHDPAARGRLECGQGPRGADLAPRGICQTVNLGIFRVTVTLNGETSTRSRKCRSWLSIGGSPNGLTRRRAIGHPHRRLGTSKLPWDMEKWKANSASHLSTPPTAAAVRLSTPLRYTNSLAGAKCRAVHPRRSVWL